MLINNILFSAELSEVLNELQLQLHINKINLLNAMKDTPDNIMVQCPYHKNGQERKPSAGIRKSDGLFHCFTCGETHSIQEVISFCFGKYDDVVGAFGWEWLLKNFLTIGIENRKDITLDFSRAKKHNSVSYVPEEILDSYRYIHPYMYQRKMNDVVIELFDIGYDKFSQCLTFPVRDIYGNCLFIARRSVNTKFFNYPSGVDKPVYGLYELQLTGGKYDTVIICESMIDAITCWVYGKKAVALNGLGNELQFNQLRNLPCRKFILATDMDDAGLTSRRRLRQNLKNKIVTEYVWDSTYAKDINDMSEEYFNNLVEIL